MVSTDLTASRALGSNALGKIVASQSTLAELSYLDGVTTFIQTQLDAKNPTISTSGQGVFLNTNVLSGYDLRWDISNVPSQVIDCLRFDGFTVAGNLNLGTSQL